jgi:hypothetical protein
MLNKGLEQAGLGWMKFKKEGRILVLVDSKTGERIRSSDRRLQGKDGAAARDLVERVNNAKHYVTLRIVDNTATVQQGAKIAEVTLVPAQPNQDSVIYFNVEALDRYQSDRDVQKMIKEVFGGKDPFNPAAFFYHEVVEAQYLAEWRASLVGQPGGARGGFLVGKQVERFDDGRTAHNRAHRLALDAERRFRGQNGIPDRDPGSPHTGWENLPDQRSGAETPVILWVRFQAQTDAWTGFGIEILEDGGFGSAFLRTDREAYRKVIERHPRR